MATADFDFEIIIDCNQVDMLEMLKVVRDYATNKKDVYFSNVSLDKGLKISDFVQLNTDEQLKQFIEDNKGKCILDGLGPYGNYMELNDIDLFREMAEIAPNGYFSAKITGCTSYTEQNLECTLKDKILHVHTYLVSNEDLQDYYIQYVKEKLSYETFIELFKINEDDFSEEDYEMYIGDYFCYEDESISQVEIEDIIENVDVECGIDEEDYDDIKSTLEELEILSYEDHLPYNKAGEENEYDYDPITKTYMNK